MNGKNMNAAHAKTMWIGLACLALAALACAAKAEPQRSKKTTSSLFAEDKGKLVITVNGQVAGTEDFSITHSGEEWVARGATELGASKGATRVTGELRLNAAGEPLRYSWSTEGDKKATSTTTFDGRTAEITVDMGDGKPFRRDFHFSSPVIVLDNNLYHQYEILAQVYNWTTGGQQNFAVFIPQGEAPGTITVDSPGPATVDGTRYDRLVMHTPDLEVMLFLDSSHRLMRLSVPAANAEVRRQ